MSRRCSIALLSLFLLLPGAVSADSKTDRKILNSLIASLRSEDPDSRIGAARELGTMGAAGAAALPALSALLRDENASVQNQAARALKKITKDADSSLAEMALAGDLGATVEDPKDASETPLHAWLFGEDQARYIVTIEDVGSLLDAARTAVVPAAKIGVTGGSSLTLPGGAPIFLGELRAAHEGWMPRYMGD